MKDFDDLQDWEQQILGLQLLLLHQQAQISLHESVLEKLLEKSLNGRALKVVFAEEMERGMRNALAEIADSDPDRASMLSQLLDLQKRPPEQPPTQD